MNELLTTGKWTSNISSARVGWTTQADTWYRYYCRKYIMVGVRWGKNYFILDYTYLVFFFLRSMCDRLTVATSQRRAVAFEAILEGATTASKTTKQRRYQTSVTSLFVWLPWYLKRQSQEKDSSNCDRPWLLSDLLLYRRTIVLANQFPGDACKGDCERQSNCSKIDFRRLRWTFGDSRTVVLAKPAKYLNEL